MARQVWCWGILGCLVVAACGGDDDDGTAGASVEAQPSVDTPGPCSLLTAEELTEVTGVEFGEGTFNEDLSAGANQICDWLAVDAFDTVQVLINPDASGFQQSRDGAVDAGMEVADVEVAGADAAYIVEGGIVATAVGDVFVQVSYLAAGDTADQAVEIAERAISRLI